MPRSRNAAPGATPSRRSLTSGMAAVAFALATRGTPVRADDDQVAMTIAEITGGAIVTPGRVTVDMPALAENGNAVPLNVVVDSPMTAGDHVKAIHVISEKNPVARILTVQLGPRAGRARIGATVRLATTQTVTVLAEMSDGRFWSGTQDVVVTIAACLDSG